MAVLDDLRESKDELPRLVTVDRARDTGAHRTPKEAETEIDRRLEPVRRS
jgi:hypothetical protein